jgi:hypothetical protein
MDIGGASVASFIATAIDGAIFWILVASSLFSFGVSDVWIGVAAMTAALVGGVIHYVLSRFWVFRRFAAPIIGSAVLYFAMSWSAAFVHGWLTGVSAGLLGAGWAWIVSKGVLWTLWTYPVSRWIVFGPMPSGTPDD